METWYYVQSDFTIHPPSVPGNPQGHSEEGTNNLSDSDLDGMLQEAKEFRDMGQPREALHLYERIIKLNPNSPSAWSGMSHPLRDLGHLDRALDAAGRALELSPQSPGAWHGHALALSEQKRSSEALEACEKAIELDPNFAYPWNVKGNCYSHLQRPEKALAAYNKCIELEPGFSFPWTNKANLFTKYPGFFGANLNLIGALETVGACYRRGIWLNNRSIRPMGDIEFRRHSQTPLASWRWLSTLNLKPQKWQRLRLLAQESLRHIAPILDTLPELECADSPEGRRRLAVINSTFGDPFLSISQWREIVSHAPGDFEAKWWLADQLLEVLELGEREKVLHQAAHETEDALLDELPEGKRFIAGLIYAALGREQDSARYLESCTGSTRFLSLLWRWKLAAMIGNVSQKKMLAEEILKIDDAAIKRGESSQFLVQDNLGDFLSACADVPPTPDDDNTVVIASVTDNGDFEEVPAAFTGPRLSPRLVSTACEKAMRKRWTIEVLLEFLEDVETLKSISEEGGNAGEIARRLLSGEQLASRSRAWGWIRAMEADVQTWIAGERVRKIKTLESQREIQRLLSAMPLDATADPSTCERGMGRWIQMKPVRPDVKVLRSILELLIYRDQIAPETFALLEAYLRFKEALENPQSVLGKCDTFTKTFKDLGSVGTVPLAIMTLAAFNVRNPDLLVTGALALTPLVLRKLSEFFARRLSIGNFPTFEEFKDELDKFGIQDWPTESKI